MTRTWRTFEIWTADGWERLPGLPENFDDLVALGRVKTQPATVGGRTVMQWRMRT